MAITLNASANHDNGAANSTTCEVSLNVAAGDLITCQWTFGKATSFVSVTDNTNPGNHTIVLNHTNSAVQNAGMSYFQNSASGAPISVTLTITPALNFSAISCQSWHGVATTGNIIDQSQQQDGTTANPTTGSNLTPVGNGELILANSIYDAVTPTAGNVNYTLVGNNTTSLQFTEYWIQTTAIATNGPFIAATDDWTDQMMFVSPTALTPGSFVPDEDFWTAPAPVPTDSIISIF